MRSWLLIVGIFLIAGCGKSAEGPATFPVQGKLTVGGQPLADVNVQLIPVDPSKLPASGKTDSQGNFSVIASNGASGAVTGKYKVVLNKAAEMSPDQYTKKGAGSPTVANLPFPREYATAGTTPKEVEVQSAAVTLDLSL